MKKLLWLLPVFILLAACTKPVTDATRVADYRTHLNDGIAHVCPAQPGTQAPALTSVQTTIAGLTAQWEVIQKAEASNGLTLPGLTVSGMTDAPTAYQTKCTMLQAMVAEANLLQTNPETESSKTEKIAIYNLADSAINSDADLNVIFTKLFADAKGAVDSYEAAKKELADKQTLYANDPSQALHAQLQGLETTLHDASVSLQAGDWAKASMILKSFETEINKVDAYKTLPTTTPGPVTTVVPATQGVQPTSQTSGGAVIIQSNPDTSAQPTVTPIVNMPQP